jgi:Ca2+-binding EF-hand superfamily protein
MATSGYPGKTVDEEQIQELIHKCVQVTFEGPKNIATIEELTQQATLAVTNFTLADKDQSGTVSFDELPGLCSFMGLPLQQDEEEMLLSMDKDGSGVLEMEEWLSWWLSRVSCLPNPLAQQEVLARNVFRKFDKDSSGSIDSTEINELFLSLGANFSPEEITEALHVLDTDDSGIVDEDEFVAWWMNRVSSKRKGGGMIALKLKRLAAKASQIYNTDIFTAIWNHDVDLVKAFIEADKRIVNSSDMSDYGVGWMPLHYASYRGYEDIVESLLDGGAKVNGTNNDGFTPIFYASQQGHEPICSRLLESGADPVVSGKYVRMCNDTNITTKEVTSTCAIDVSFLYPNILSLFKAHPKCKQPIPLSANQFSASLSRKGILTIDLPAQRTYTAVPVRSWSMQLFPDVASGDSKGEKGDKDDKDTMQQRKKMTFAAQAKAPTENQQVVVGLEKGWMRVILDCGQDICLKCRVAAVDAFRETTEYSDWIKVDYSPPVTASEKKSAEDNMDDINIEAAEAVDGDIDITADAKADGNNLDDTAGLEQTEGLDGVEDLRVIDGGAPEEGHRENENDYSHNFDTDDEHGSPPRYSADAK